MAQEGREKVMSDLKLIEEIRNTACPLTGSAKDFDLLLDLVGEARFVLLGEATHGTHEFYRLRGEITKRLIQQKGFHAVAVEADWPDAYRVNRYVRNGYQDEMTSVDALSGFKRFPSWMWRNADVLDFVGWLKEYNADLPKGRRKIGFYGMDLYSLYASIQAIIHFLEKIDPEAAKRARYRYACFEHFGEEPQSYGYAANFGLSESCEDEVISQLLDLQRHAVIYAQRDGRLAPDDLFYIEQNAKVIKSAEEYYRTMFRGNVASWNLRDRYMVSTIDSLVNYLSMTEGPTKIVIWAHNSHIGDARATEMNRRGEINVGQIIREEYGHDVVLIGFTTDTGTVTAASDWDTPAERKQVRSALSGSFEALFHEVAIPSFSLIFQENKALQEGLQDPRLERAIGVIYLPQSERISHYFLASLSDQFDAVIHIDESRAVEPLERSVEWQMGEEPETYPFAV